MESEIPRGSTIYPHIVQVHFDGACERFGSGSVATYGFTVEGEGLDHEDLGLAVPPFSVHATNNVAEYVAAVRALEWLRGRKFTGHVLLIGDSQLVVRQMKGEYAVRREHLKGYHKHLHQLARGFAEVTYEWVRREENRRADALSKEAMEEFRRASAWARPRRPAEDDHLLSE